MISLDCPIAPSYTRQPAAETGVAELVVIDEWFERTPGDNRRYGGTFVKDQRWHQAVDLKAGFALW